MVYIPGVEYDGPLPEAEPYFNISNRFWKRPKNWEQIIDAVRWAANDDVPLQVSGPDFLVANLVEQAARQRRLIHLVNYDARNTPTISSVQVTCAIPDGKVAKDVSLYEVDSDSPQALSFTPGPFVRLVHDSRGEDLRGHRGQLVDSWRGTGGRGGTGFQPVTVTARMAVPQS